MTFVKTLLNSVISATNGCFMTGDIKDFYLNSTMAPKNYACMRIPIAVIPDTVMTEYKLARLVHHGFVYVEIRKGMYAVCPRRGPSPDDRLTKFLAPHGYAPVPITPGLWRHYTKPLSFTLVVDDFGVKCTNKADAQHLISTLQLLYSVTEDWEPTQYCGLTLEFHYAARTCGISMPGYIQRTLQRFKHPNPKRP
jgi:hypothetical protein